jgi:hypothetical protein
MVLKSISGCTLPDGISSSAMPMMPFGRRTIGFLIRWCILSLVAQLWDQQVRMVAGIVRHSRRRKLNRVVRLDSSVAASMRMNFN